VVLFGQSSPASYGEFENGIGVQPVSLVGVTHLYRYASLTQRGLTFRKTESSSPIGFRSTDFQDH
jgi:hypothetical protein